MGLGAALPTHPAWPDNSEKVQRLPAPHPYPHLPWAFGQTMTGTRPFLKLQAWPPAQGRRENSKGLRVDESQRPQIQSRMDGGQGCMLHHQAGGLQALSCQFQHSHSLLVDTHTYSLFKHYTCTVLINSHTNSHFLNTLYTLTSHAHSTWTLTTHALFKWTLNTHAHSLMHTPWAQ